MEASTVPMLIVGAGPVGLSLALELGRFGIDVTLIDEGAGVVEHPRGTGVSERTMEYFRRWGLAERIRDGFSDDLPLNQVFCASMAGPDFGVSRFPALGATAPSPASPVTYRRCSQNWWDATLSEAARAEPTVDLCYRHRLEELHCNTADGVVVGVLDMETGQRAEVKARYLIGCDGIQSATRELVGIDRVGDTTLHYSMSVLFTAKDLFDQLGREPGERFIVLGPEGPIGNVTSIDGGDTWRLLVRGGDQHFNLDSFDPRPHIVRALGRDDVAFDVVSVLPWRNAQWVAGSYGRGSVFLAGDSAHAMSPAGGFGANTGISDAMNLAWKLAGRLSGWGGAALLDSYEAERKPVAQRNAAFALRNTKAWMPESDELASAFGDTPEAAVLRRAIGEQLVEATHAEWQSTGVSLGYCYEDSPICWLDGSPPPLDDPVEPTQTARPGARAPHGWLADGRSMLDLYGHAFTLVRFPDAAGSGLVDAARRRGLPLDVADVDDSSIARLYQRALVLVRPDGHVAWRADTDAAEDPEAVLDRVLGSDTSS